MSRRRCGNCDFHVGTEACSRCGNALTPPLEPPRHNKGYIKAKALKAKAKTKEPARRITRKGTPVVAPESVDVDALREWAEREGYGAVNLRVEVGRCLDWHRAHGILRADWLATARNWIRKAGEESKPRPGGRTYRPGDL